VDVIEGPVPSDRGPTPTPPPPSIFTFPNRIVFGAGALRWLPEELRRLNVRRPMVVTDAGLTASGLADAAVGLLESPVVFDEVQANPAEADVARGVERFRASGCDGLVGLGGGSPIDAAKAIRLLHSHPGALADYDVTQGGLEKITADMVPMAAVPTTAGTGSEAGRGALIQAPATGRKIAVLSPYLLPSVAVCDPDLTLTLPPALTAGTGMDALTHCLESYLSTTYHPVCDGIAVEGLRFLFRGLETAVHDGADREARSSTMMGALLGGISFHKGLGVVHALSHALGSEGRVHHGTLNAVLLAHALRFNREAAEPRMTELAARVGLGRAGDGPGHLITLVELIMARMPLPRRLGQVDGLSRDRIGDYARLAMLDHCRLTNPRPCTQANLEELLDRAW
jgi:alcohol dehydrogenase class IV